MTNPSCWFCLIDLFGCTTISCIQRRMHVEGTEIYFSDWFCSSMRSPHATPPPQHYHISSFLWKISLNSFSNNKTPGKHILIHIPLFLFIVFFLFTHWLETNKQTHTQRHTFAWIGFSRSLCSLYSILCNVLFHFSLFIYFACVNSWCACVVAVFFFIHLDLYTHANTRWRGCLWEWESVVIEHLEL